MLFMVLSFRIKCDTFIYAGDILSLPITFYFFLSLSFTVHCSFLLDTFTLCGSLIMIVLSECNDKILMF